MSGTAVADVERAAAVLRLLGRVEFARAKWVRDLIFPDRSDRWARMVLAKLHANRLIWKASAPAARVPGSIGGSNKQPPPIAPHIYGLTPEGRDELAALGIEGDGTAIASMPVRPWADPDLKLAQLRHDLLVSDWCCAALYGARKHPRLHSMHCQVEYVSAAADNGQAIQRFDALVMFTIAAVPMPPMPAWAIPWADGTPTPDGAITCRFAAEIDTGSEKLAILLGKAGTYRALTLSRHYTATLGGPVLPVVLVPSGTKRAGQIAREWQDGWPDGAGVVGSFTGAQIDQDAIRGRYLAMTSKPAREAFLLEPFGITRETWDDAIADRRRPDGDDRVRRQGATR